DRPDGGPRGPRRRGAQRQPGRGISVMSTATLERALVERLVRQALTVRLPGNGQAATQAPPRLVVNISARHCHVTQDDLERLFGKGHRLTVHKALYQDGFFAAAETVTIIGPR